MTKYSRRGFFRSIGRQRDPASPNAQRAEEPRPSQNPEGNEEANEAETAGTFQFSLMTLFVITTVVSFLLAVAKAWPRDALLVAAITLALTERVYRKRIKATLGSRNYDLAALLLEHLFGAMGGAILGAFLGFILYVMVLRVWLPVVLGGFLGGVFGLLCPRAVRIVFAFLVFLP